MGEWHLNFRRPSRAQLQRKQVANTKEVDKPLLIGGRMCDLWRRSLKVLRLLFLENFVFGVPVSGCKQAKIASRCEVSIGCCPFDGELGG
jgi:hypothetical protein